MNAKKKARMGFLFCLLRFHGLLGKAVVHQLVEVTHWSFSSSPASVITVSSRSSADRAIMGPAFQASICRCRAVTASRVSRSVSGNWSMMASATSRSVWSTIHCCARAMALAKP